MLILAGVISEKPNYIDQKGDSVHKQNIASVLTDEQKVQSNKQLAATLTQVTLVPTVKYNVPQTAAQEVGWFVHPEVFHPF